MFSAWRYLREALRARTHARSSACAGAYRGEARSIDQINDTVETRSGPLHVFVGLIVGIKGAVTNVLRFSFQ